MGKASKWFRAVLGLKKPDAHEQPSTTGTRSSDKRRWSFVKSYRENDPTPLQNQRNVNADDDPNRHAIAVAAAKAAAAERAVAAANAAAETVRLMNSRRCDVNLVTAYGNGSRGRREGLAAVKIQSAFRGYLARRALRALRALVRLQALVRGHVQRKRMAKEAQWMQSMMRVQARARAGRLLISESSSKTTTHLHHHPGPPTPEKIEHAARAKSGKYEQSSMLKKIGDGEKAVASFNWSEQRVPCARTCSFSDEKSDKILEVDMVVKPHFTRKQRRNRFHSSMNGLASDQHSYSFTTWKDSHRSVPSASSGEVQSQSATPMKFTGQDDEAYCTTQNSPHFHSATSRGASGRSPFTPSKSDGAGSFLSGYSDYYPSYMSNTESSKAKVRSLSAPKQRPQYERSGSAKRCSMNGLGEMRSSSAQRASTKAYPGSGRLDRLGLPVGQRY